ncbi:Cyclic nucleotide-binding domain-containing protein [Desulfobotulus alkaliphilus]|uniref:Cyclic nucleotide-binding domain-containing protein n=1 Tax=Desulfobotulus alkaliphilus TaxID=622671 RepID=A0A562S654_9BACT|nr:cyclic nucleotide-binding domain-containing protein [Desulfobotulus alkaliphilus]TWI76839.1 Cyclic nucleotide-binding domain-containing protein [Desulfobotulus alkaliphilus]
MITSEILKNYPILESLTQKELEKITPLCHEVHFEEGQVIYKEGDTAETFFLLQSGLVLLEERLHTTMAVTVGTLKPGAAFGLTSILDNTGYSLNAISAGTTELIMINGSGLIDLFEKDHTIGYKIMRATVSIIQNRLSHRTQQFVRSISEHPDIEDLNEE